MDRDTFHDFPDLDDPFDCSLTEEFAMGTLLESGCAGVHGAPFEGVRYGGKGGAWLKASNPPHPCAALGPSVAAPTLAPACAPSVGWEPLRR